MALLWAEPFDQYGSSLSVANVAIMMQQFGYSTVVQPNSMVTGASARNGISCRMAGSNGLMKRSLTAAVNTIGMGCGVYFNAATGGHNAVINSSPAAAESAGGTEFVVIQNATNGYDIFDRTNTKIGSTPANVWTLTAWHWLEVKAKNNAATGALGSIELRINGITQLLVNGVNLPNAFTIARIGGNGLWDATLDDWVVWDDSGTVNNDFLGDRRLIWSIPNATTAQADFTASAGTTTSCINTAPPPGAPAGDTAFIQGAASGNISEFGRSSINIAGNDIAGIVLVGRLAKSDTGACSAKLGINSNGFVVNSPDINPGVSFAYSQYIVEKDPNGNIQWTRAAVDAALSRITRSA